MRTFDPSDPQFWDEADLSEETDRIFAICHGCRLCDRLCPSFDVLFRRIDAIDDAMGGVQTGHSPVEELTAEDKRTVSDLCYQCKLCFPKCPYTPPHEYMLDFPKLLLREQAVHKKKTGISFSERVLANPDLIGRVGSAVPRLVNAVNRSSALRVVMEKTAGIHRAAPLPEYHGETFEQWFASWKRGRGAVADPAARVAVYATCLVNFNRPDVGRALVRILDHNNVEVISCGASCCGMPAMSTGDLSEAARRADAVIAALDPLVRDGYDIVIPSPSCSLNMRQDYVTVASDRDAARRVAARCFDTAEYLMRMHARGKLRTDFTDAGGSFLYHLPCHLKAQNIGYKTRDLLRLLPGAQVTMSQRCSGHDGQWSMRREYHQMSLTVGGRLFSDVRAAGNATVVSDCVLAHHHIAEGAGASALHPLEVICHAYGLD